MTGHAAVVAGGGPTGLMLAGELALAGIDVAIVERRAGRELCGARAGGLHSRTIEVLEQRGIADRFLAEGRAIQVQSFAHIPLDLGDFPGRHSYGLALRQGHFERILGGWVDELGVPIYHGREVVGLTQDGEGVDVGLSDGRSLRTGYLIGCDGGRSLVRKAAGIDFPGWDPSISSLLAEVEMREKPQWGIRYGESGTQALGPMEGEERVRVVLTERFTGQDREPTLDDVSRALRRVYGTDFGSHSPTSISRFTDTTRQAASYREGRVLLAGDAAHVHYPIGGQGLNIGVQDAVNLGWKLAQVLKGASPESLLDTYQSERHPVAARVLRSTMAQVVLARSDARVEALRDTVVELLGMDEPRRHMAAMLSGLDVHYDLGEGHPLLGRRMPDLDLETAGGPTRVSTLLHDARPLLLNFAGPGGRAWTISSGRVRSVDVTHRGAWELPVLGEVERTPAVLIRPDGYVAWAGAPGDSGLARAMVGWFGAGAPT